MSKSVFEEMVQQIGFDEPDVANLRSLHALICANASSIVDRFYAELERHPGMRAILDQSDATKEHLRLTLTEWIKALTSGFADPSYSERRSLIGRAHVRVGMPQHYMLTAMRFIRGELAATIERAEIADAPGKLKSLDKVLTLELGLMLESYGEQTAASVKQKERSRVEERLTRAERLAEIGKLAASLAHEIKNPLAGISGAIQIIRDGMEPDYKHREIIGEILGQINRLDAVVKDLLVYARPVPPQLSYCHLDAIVRRVLTFMGEESTAKRARLEFTATNHDVGIHADETKIEQLILNLLLNAAQASPDGGTIRVGTEVDGDQVRLVVEDNGHGMDETVRQRAFEPFFTTKAKGTGLGLPICKTIVEAHGGRISLHSVVGEGARVVVEFPIEQAETPGG